MLYLYFQENQKKIEKYNERSATKTFAHLNKLIVLASALKKNDLKLKSNSKQESEKEQKIF